MSQSGYDLNEEVCYLSRLSIARTLGFIGLQSLGKSRYERPLVRQPRQLPVHTA